MNIKINILHEYKAMQTIVENKPKWTLFKENIKCLLELC